MTAAVFIAAENQGKAFVNLQKTYLIIGTQSKNIVGTGKFITLKGALDKICLRTTGLIKSK